MPHLKTTLLVGSMPNPESVVQIQQSVGLSASASVIFMVYQIEFEGELYYCCWSGGEVKDGETYLTTVGQGAMEALANLPLGSNDKLVIKHLKIGPTPLKDKVVGTLRLVAPGTKICFFGDLQGELDGQMEAAFNVQSGSIRIKSPTSVH